MNVQGISGATSAPIENKGADALDGLLGKGGDPYSDLEVLMAKDGQLQRSVARSRQDRGRAARQRELQKALDKTKEQFGFQLGQRILSATLDLAGKACQAAGCESALLDALISTNETVQPVGMVAEGLQLDAEAARIEAQGFGDKAADAGQWLNSVRDLEQRMLSRLENLDRTRHEGIMRASSFE